MYKKLAIVGAAAAVAMGLPLASMGPASAAEVNGNSDNVKISPESDVGVMGYWCNAGGVGTGAASATCYNQTDQARYAHFHVDCWAWGDNDTDQTKWVGPWGSVSFYHTCWSHVQGLEAYFY